MNYRLIRRICGKHRNRCSLPTYESREKPGPPLSRLPALIRVEGEQTKRTCNSLTKIDIKTNSKTSLSEISRAAAPAAENLKAQAQQQHAHWGAVAGIASEARLPPNHLVTARPVSSSPSLRRQGATLSEWFVASMRSTVPSSKMKFGRCSLPEIPSIPVIQRLRQLFRGMPSWGGMLNHTMRGLQAYYAVLRPSL
jgi:hypothetical protein